MAFANSGDFQYIVAMKQVIKVAQTCTFKIASSLLGFALELRHIWSSNVKRKRRKYYFLIISLLVKSSLKNYGIFILFDIAQPCPIQNLNTLNMCG